MGSDDVAMTLESDYAPYKNYIEGNEDILNEEYSIQDVLDAKTIFLAYDVVLTGTRSNENDV